MAPLALFDTSIVEFTRAATSFATILSVAKEHASSPDVANSYPALKLAEDMLPLSFQVGIFSNTCKRSIERLAPSKTASLPNWDAEELKTLDDLIARVDAVKKMLETVQAEDVAGVDEKIVECGLGKTETAKLEAKGYLLGYALPNVFFHLSIAYAILRKEGVPLGKRSYLNSFMEPVVVEMVKHE